MHTKYLFKTCTHTHPLWMLEPGSVQIIELRQSNVCLFCYRQGSKITSRPGIAQKTKRTVLYPSTECIAYSLNKERIAPVLQAGC